MEITIGSYHKKYLISGYKGAVGTLLCNLTQEVEFFDINKKVFGVDVFLHLAGTTKEEKIIESNIVYLKEVVDYCKQNKIKKLVYFSSVSVYGKQNKLHINERVIGDNLSLYASSKLFAENYLQSIKELDILVLRLPAILTKRNDTYLSQLFDKLKRNENITLFNYTRYFNGFVCVDDILRFIKMYSFTRKFEIINFASQQKQTLKDSVVYLKELLNSESEIFYNDEDKAFYNLSIDKLESKHNFIPMDYKDSLKKWVEINSER